MSTPTDSTKSETKTRDSDRTRGELLVAGRDLFTEAGYANAHTQEIVMRSGRTRGSLYHHFGNKAGLFRAVFEEIQAEITAEVVSAAVGIEAPIERIRAGFHAYLDACMREDVRRIVLVDGPAVLGWATWHEIDQRQAFGLTRGAIEVAMTQGDFREAPLDAMTHVLLGAITQASLGIAMAHDPLIDRREIGEVVDLILARLANDRGASNGV